MELQEFKQTALLDTDVSFAIENGLWLNATQVAKTYGKDLSNYWKSSQTESYMNAVSKAVESTELKNAVKGKYGGTYLHPKMVIHFARWISDDFAVACDEFITQQLIAKQVKITEVANKEIARLKAQKKLVNIYDGKWTSARGLVQHTDTVYKETEIKDFMYSMGLIEPEHKVTRFWKTTAKGINSKLVKSDDMNTPIYDMSKTIEYMDNFKSLLNNMQPVEQRED